MIEFQLPDGNPVSVNPAEIDYFKPADDWTFVAMKDGCELSVTNDYADVAAAFAEHVVG